MPHSKCGSVDMIALSLCLTIFHSYHICPSNWHNARTWTLKIAKHLLLNDFIFVSFWYAIASLLALCTMKKQFVSIVARYGGGKIYVKQPMKIPYCNRTLEISYQKFGINYKTRCKCNRIFLSFFFLGNYPKHVCFGQSSIWFSKGI